MLKTVKQCAEILNLSESRMRAILGKKGAPTPVIDSVNVYQGKQPGKYDLNQIEQFYFESKKKPGRKLEIDYWREQ